MIQSVLIAAWLGILTSVSPCPLATNIAAVSFLARKMHSRRLAVAGAVVYALGRATVYVLIGLILAVGLAAAPGLSHGLQSLVTPFVGPLLIIVALVLLGWLSLPIDIGMQNEGRAERWARFGLLGEFSLGMVFALTFCPVSAALFFGTVLPMALGSGAALPVFAVYGLATAIPVGVLAVMIALGVGATGVVLQNIQKWQGWIRGISGGLILAVGVWLTLRLFF